MSEQTAKPTELLSAKSWAVQRIRALIYSGVLPPEQKISLDALARQLNVSRTPVRDAIWQLAGEGLVSVSPRVGAFVRRVSRQEAEDIYRLKEAIEPLMAAWASERAGPVERAQYCQMVQKLHAIAGRGDVEAYIQYLEECRGTLLDLAGSVPLSDILSVIDGRVRLLRFRNLSQPGRLAVSAEQHIAVAVAVRDGDGERARSAMSLHVGDAARRVRAILDDDTGGDALAPRGGRTASR